MSCACFLLFIFVTAPDPEAGGKKKSRQGCKELQTFGLGAKGGEQTLGIAADPGGVPRCMVGWDGVGLDGLRALFQP